MKGFVKVERLISITVNHKKDGDFSGRLLWYSKDMICLRGGCLKFYFKKDIRFINLWKEECDEDIVVLLNAFSKNKKKKKLKDKIKEFDFGYNAEKKFEQEFDINFDYKSNIPEDMLSSDNLPTGYTSDDFGISFSGIGSVNDK